MHPSPSPSTARTALGARAAGPRASRAATTALPRRGTSSLTPLIAAGEEGASRSQIKPSCASKSASLADYVLVFMAVFMDHLVEDLDELVVLLERLRGGGDRGRGANGKSPQRRVVVEVCEDVRCRRIGIVKDFLSSGDGDSAYALVPEIKCGAANLQCGGSWSALSRSERNCSCSEEPIALRRPALRR